MLAADGINWLAYDQSDILVKPGSALDFSAFIELGPAGKHGMAIINAQGQLAFTHQPDKPQRFFGCAFPMFEFDYTTDEQIAQLAQQIQMAGYNVVRPHWLDLYLMDHAPADFVFNPLHIKRFDRFTWELKKRGIYLIIDGVSNSTMYTALTQRFGGKQRNKMSKLRQYYDPEIQEHWKKGVKILLEHVNPHSGLAMKDDPQVLYIAARNEPGVNFQLAVKGKRALPFLEAGIKPLFIQWLKKRYVTLDNLNKAWKNEAQSYATFQDIAWPERHTQNADTADVHRFITELEQQTYIWMSDWLRHVGVKYPIVDYNNGQSFQCAMTRMVMPMVDIHGYYDHAKGWGLSAKIKGNSLVETGAALATRLSSVRQWGSPLMVTEWGMPYFNPWRYESGLVMGSYASLQNWQMMMQHALPVRLTIKQGPRMFRVGDDPTLKAGERMAALLFGRGDVQKARGVIGVHVDDAVSTSLGWTRTLSNDIVQLGLVSQLGMVLPKGSAMRAPVKPDLLLTPSQGTMVVAGLGAGAETFHEVTGESPVFQYAMNYLKQRSIVSSDNDTDVRKGIFQSDTGELTIKPKSKYFAVDTPMCQGATLPQAGMSAILRDVTLRNQGVPVAILLASLDSKPINQSQRMLLIISTDSSATDAQFFNQGKQVKHYGRLPALIQPATVRLKLRHANASRLRVWALRANGSRARELKNVRLLETGQWQLDIAVDALKNEATPYFEIQIQSASHYTRRQ